MTASPHPRTTHFGFQRVPEQEKAGRVREVFDRVAGRYDLMNDLMSAGLHRFWKDQMVAWLAPRDGMHILDVAGGTADIAFRLRDAANCRVTVCDINAAMLSEGRCRAIDSNRLQGYDWLCANAESLPLPEGSVDAYTIAFGIRNVTHIDQALAEALRVLRKGGRFMCLEFSHLHHPQLQKLYDRYSFGVIPRLGQIITGDAAPYRYLVESIRQFPDQKEFARMIGEAGFSNVQHRSLMQGVVAIHSGRKL